MFCKFLLAMEMCVTAPCKNGAKCEDVAGGYHCHCTGKYYGRNCADSMYLSMTLIYITFLKNQSKQSTFYETALLLCRASRLSLLGYAYR